MVKSRKFIPITLYITLFITLFSLHLARANYTAKIDDSLDYYENGSIPAVNTPSDGNVLTWNASIGQAQWISNDFVIYTIPRIPENVFFEGVQVTFGGENVVF